MIGTTEIKSGILSRREGWFFKIGISHAILLTAIYFGFLKQVSKAKTTCNYNCKLLMKGSRNELKFE
jgi:hypothetical protein